MNTLRHGINIALLATTSLLSIAAHAQTPSFPIRADELNLSHRIKTTNHWSGGAQALAKDMDVVRNTGGTSWDRLVAGGSATTNADYLIYNKPVRAMAAGTVVSCWRNHPQNVAQSKLAYVGTKIGYGGNHVAILQDDGNYAFYAHAITGTVPATLCPHNATYLTNEQGGPWVSDAAVTGGVRVNAGDFLFNAGNSGNSSNPHLHVHIEKGGAAIALKFARGATTSNVGGNSAYNGPWTNLSGGALPAGEILIWPAHSTAYWTVNNIQDENFQAWFNHMVDSGEMPENMPCTNNGQIYNSDWVPSHGAWTASHGMTAFDFTVKNANNSANGYSLYKYWYCDSIRSAIWRK